MQTVQALLTIEFRAKNNKLMLSALLFSLLAHLLVFYFVKIERPRTKLKPFEAPAIQITLSAPAMEVTPEETLLQGEEPQEEELQLDKELQPEEEPQPTISAQSYSPAQRPKPFTGVFDPRLRDRAQAGLSRPKRRAHGEKVIIGDTQYYPIGNGECISERVGGYGIVNTSSPEYLMMNVSRGKCPWTKTEGQEMIEGLRKALNREYSLD